MVPVVLFETKVHRSSSFPLSMLNSGGINDKSNASEKGPSGYKVSPHSFYRSLY